MAQARTDGQGQVEEVSSGASRAGAELIQVGDALELPAQTAALDQVVRRVWGFDQFRPLQREAMEAILGAHDSLVVLPTGGGKSLCFQAPALIGEGLAVVVSPLIALMKDQVDSLRSNGVAAAAWNSSLDAEARGEVRQALRDRSLDLLYVSPERLVGEGGASFQELLRQAGARFVAIDEAHCISQWGHDFRPEYRQFGELRRAMPGVSIHAFTATATERVRADIVEQLGLVDARVLVGSFDRPNLIYRVQRRSKGRDQVLGVVRRHANEGGIVYCISRREVESMAAGLAAAGVRALPYHAGFESQERAKVQDAFLEERIDVVVATVAFGMGIDRSNVRFVVHAGAPRSIEHYQQEAGRAGRDGLPAECVLLYSPADFLKWRRLMEQNGTPTEADLAHLREMEGFAAKASCRHRFLLEYFGETPQEKSDCGACDWCLGELEEVSGSTVLAQKVLSCVARVRQRYGSGHVVDILRGRSTVKVRQRQHDELSTFGLLKGSSASELRGYIDQMVELGFLAFEGSPYPVLHLTEQGVILLRGDSSCTLYRPPKPPSAPKAGRAATTLAEGDESLFESLRSLRKGIARERGVPPYVVFHDATLAELARRRPKTPTDLLQIRGLGQKKVTDYGERIVECIRAAD